MGSKTTSITLTLISRAQEKDVKNTSILEHNFKLLPRAVNGTYGPSNQATHINRNSNKNKYKYTQGYLDSK